MSAKPPFDFSEFMKLYDPQQVAKMFSPEHFMSAFAPLSEKGVDVQAMMDTNKRNLEAMAAANRAAAEAGKEFYERQMATFEQITGAAKEFALFILLWSLQSPWPAKQKPSPRSTA